MPSSHAATQRTSDTRTNAGVPQVGPRENLRSLVIKLSRASRQEGLSSSTAGELREAAHALNLADPRFWGGGHGVPADELARDLAEARAGTDLLALQQGRWAVRRLAGQGDTAELRSFLGLHRVQPEDLRPSDITARLGAPWIPAGDVEGHGVLRGQLHVADRGAAALGDGLAGRGRGCRGRGRRAVAGRCGRGAGRQDRLARRRGRGRRP